MRERGMAVDLKRERGVAAVTGAPAAVPDARGRFGQFGGKYAPETLMPALDELESAYAEARRDPKFQDLVDRLARDYVGRPTPLYFARNLTDLGGGARIYLKREDLAHTGAHKINNALGQGLLARRMGKQRIIAETGAGQHGVASATVCAMLDLECIVYMGEEDVHRQSLNVFRMKLLGAEVRSVTGGGARAQCLERLGRLPDAVVACVGGGSNAIGIFHPFVDDREVRLLGAEAAGHGVESGRHAATLVAGRPGVLHGARSYLLQDEWGQVAEAHSISAGLDYPGVGPEHAYL